MAALRLSPRTRRLIQLGFGAAVIAGTIAIVGTGPLVRGLLAISPGAILAAALLTGAATFAAAWRWRTISSELGLPMRWTSAVAAYYRSQFLNTVLPGGVIGDVHRAYRQGRRAQDLPIAARAVVDACVASGVPALFSLTVVGRVRLSPHDAADAEIGAAFDDHQRRVVDGRRLLGPDGAETVRSLFSAGGWRVRTERTPWRLGSDSGPLIAEWLDGWIGAAGEQRSELLPGATDYRARRDAQIARGRLRVTVQHQDVLAWPR